jgi:hypothetical protein
MKNFEAVILDWVRLPAAFFAMWQQAIAISAMARV